MGLPAGGSGGKRYPRGIKAPPRLWSVLNICDYMDTIPFVLLEARQGLLFFPLVSTSKGRLVMCLWSSHNGQHCECSFVLRCRSSRGRRISRSYRKCVVKLEARHQGGFYVVARDATLNIPVLCAWNEEKLTFWLPIREWNTWFTALLQH